MAAVPVEEKGTQTDQHDEDMRAVPGPEDGEGDDEEPVFDYEKQMNIVPPPRPHK